MNPPPHLPLFPPPLLLLLLPWWWFQPGVGWWPYYCTSATTNFQPAPLHLPRPFKGKGGKGGGKHRCLAAVICPLLSPLYAHLCHHKLSPTPSCPLPAFPLLQEGWVGSFPAKFPQRR